MGEPADLRHLEADARYAREKLDLYRAKTYSGRPTSETRLRELQRQADQTRERLEAARRSP
jgi:hypothetical protein